MMQSPPVWYTRRCDSLAQVLNAAGDILFVIPASNMSSPGILEYKNREISFFFMSLLFLKVHPTVQRGAHFVYVN